MVGEGGAGITIDFLSSNDNYNNSNDLFLSDVSSNKVNSMMDTIELKFDMPFMNDHIHIWGEPSKMSHWVWK